MNKIIVSKFGGSSMSEASHIIKAAQIVKSNPLRRYVVVSAPGKSSGTELGITDMLYLCHAQFNGKEDLAAMLERIRSCYAGIVEGLGINFSVDGAMDSIRENISSGKSAAYIASRGEYFMAKIFAQYIGWEMIDAAEIIRFKPDASLDEEETFRLSAERLLNTNHAVIPGFYGSLPDGDIKTFQRGAGDITGGLITRAVNAGTFEKWNRTKEIWSADPSIVDNPEIVRYLTYSEAMELNYIGIKTTQDEVLMTLRETGTPINIRSISDSEDPGTIISGTIPEGSRKNVAVCIGGRRSFNIIQIEKYGLNKEAGFGEKLFGIFARYCIPCEHCLSGIYKMSVVLKSPLYALRRNQVIATIQETFDISSINEEKNLSLITVVGDGMGTAYGTFERVFSSLNGAGIKARMIDQGSDNLNIMLGVRDEDYNTAVKALYTGMIIS